MYVCICNSITDRQVRDAVHKGQDTLPKLRESLGLGACCGKCEECAAALLRDIAAESDDLNLVAAAA